MKLKEVSKYFAAPVRVFTTGLILLIILTIVQGIISEILLSIQHRRYQAQTNRQLLQTQKSEEQKRTERIHSFDKKFTPDGTIHLAGYITDPFPLYGLSGSIKPGLYAVYDVNYNLLWTGREEKIPYEYLSWQDRRDRWDWRDPITTIRIRELQTITPGFSRSLEIQNFAGEEGVQIWRYEPKEQLFKGYEAGGDPIGYISAAGFTKSKADVKPFGTVSILCGWMADTAGSTLEPVCVLQTDRRFFEVDFARRTAELLFESPQAKIVRYITFHNWAALESEPSTDSKIRYRPTIHCITEDRNHHLVMRNPKEVITVRMPKDWHSLSVEMTATEQTVFLERRETVGFPPEGEEINSVLDYQLMSKWREETKGQPTTHTTGLYKLNEKGGLEYVNGITWEEPAYPRRDVPDSTTSNRYVSFVSPQLYDIVWSLWAAEQYRPAWQMVELNLPSPLSVVAVVIEMVRPKESILHWMVNILMVAVVFWHGWSRRTGWGKFIFWIVFVGLFNLAGLLTYLALNHTPVISCPACGKKRGLERLDCIYCGSDLPRPQKRATDLVLNF
jgi:hypothetical protein